MVHLPACRLLNQHKKAPMINHAHLNIRVTGKVQGVFFRATAMDKAIELSINGFVRNEADGSVYIEAEGRSKNMEGFLEWCRTGPQFSKVDKVAIEESPLCNYLKFEIKRFG